ncbi:DUF192 domain-containing protein [Aliiglaciecola litoralis]
MQKIMINRVFGLALILCISISAVFAQDVEFDRATVQLESEQFSMQLNVEYAQTFEQRAQGLMYRESMCENCGMLFEYSHARIASMWMKNTLLPLDVAFVDKDGIITDIIAMQPHDLTSVRSSKEVLYALEMNQGWFTKQGFKVGDTMRVVNEVQ